jgi:citrate lyase subunit beta/citryl-CoA lyase
VNAVLRRAALCVPASEPTRIRKAAALRVDEIIVDLEDAVLSDAKDEARRNISGLQAREHGVIAVRINAIGTSWCERDLLACVTNPAVTTVVIPKVESADDLRTIDSEVTAMASAAGRTSPLALQALIESAKGLSNVESILASSPRITSCVIGYADLSVSLGRQPSAGWQYAQDRVVLAARANRIQPIDGPRLSVEDDADLRTDAVTAATSGFDGKWVIHPRQVETVQQAFTPTPAQVAEAREIVTAMDEAAANGRGAVQWRGRMIDEPVVQQARRVIARSLVG